MATLPLLARAATASAARQCLSRLLAAVLGGYALASAAALFFGVVLPVARVDAALAGMQLSFVLHVAAVIWAFAPLSLARVWWGLGLLSGALIALARLLSGAGGW